MTYRLAADVVVAIHMAFVAFLVAGGFVARRWPEVALPHLAALAISAAIYLGGFDCPLTTLEKHLRQTGGEGVYGEGFIAHYLVSPVLGAGMTAAIGFALVGLVVAATAVAYGDRLARHLLGR